MRAAAAAALLLLTACPQRTAVWPAGGSTATDLTFVLGQRSGHERAISTFLRIDRCDADRRGPPLWKGAVDGSRVSYGRRNPAADLSGAEPLRPGCYEATTTGTGRVRFVVDDAGGVQALPGTG